jgi:hypothetical protein
VLSEQLSRAVDYERELEQDAGQAWVGREDRREQEPVAAADVEERADAAEVVCVRRC